MDVTRASRRCSLRGNLLRNHGLTSECESFRLFSTTESRYVNYWADVIGNAKIAAQRRTLPKYQYLLHRDGEDAEIRCAGKLIKEKF